MGLIQGDSIIVMDAFALPVEGTETSAGPHLITGNGVGFKPDILDMDIMEKVLEVKGEDAVKMAQQLSLQEGLLVSIDVSTQMLNQQFQEPFLVVVIDPTRTVFANKVDIGAFRTYPKDYMPPDEPVSEYQTIPLNKIEDFDVHCKQFVLAINRESDNYFCATQLINYSKLKGNWHTVDLACPLNYSKLKGNYSKKEFDTILDMEKDELVLEIEEEEVRRYRL
ncbi:COP9 signalosome complex subunit 5b [Hordeum vulgare]|nr:COP9 signalosome complex subunit 5b [Hordeum vulgare]